MTEPDLFTYVPHNGTDTSRAAADSMKPHVSDLEREVLQFVKLCGGATCDEIEYGKGMAHQTASARIKGLADKGLVRDSGARRKTRSGRQARVYVVCG